MTDSRDHVDRMSSPGAEDAAGRRARRREASDAHVEAIDRRRAVESARARVLLAEFVAEATRSGPAPVRLRARSFDGRHRYRTAMLGWYLRVNESVAVGTDGEFYVLSTPSSFFALLRGAVVGPSEPPLVLGAGGRDGESIALVEALARVSARRTGDHR